MASTEIHVTQNDIDLAVDLLTGDGERPPLPACDPVAIAIARALDLDTIMVTGDAVYLPTGRRKLPGRARAAVAAFDAALRADAWGPDTAEWGEPFSFKL